MIRCLNSTPGPRDGSNTTAAESFWLPESPSTIGFRQKPGPQARRTPASRYRFRHRAHTIKVFLSGRKTMRCTMKSFNIYFAYASSFKVPDEPQRKGRSSAVQVFPSHYSAGYKHRCQQTGSRSCALYRAICHLLNATQQ